MDKPQSFTLDKASLPSVLSYPKIFSISDMPEIIGQFCYVIKAHNLHGIAVVIQINGDDTIIRFGDWDGNHPPKAYEKAFMEKYCAKFIQLMRSAKIHQLELYISCEGEKMILSDVRVAMDRLASPGYIKDIFGKAMPSQEIIGSPIVITKEVVDGMVKSGDRVILKPSLFKTIVKDGEVHALYAKNWK